MNGLIVVGEKYLQNSGMTSKPMETNCSGSWGIMGTSNFDEAIKPFFLVRHADSVSACLDAGDSKREIFEKRADEGFEGNGYDWTSLATVFLEEIVPDMKEKIKFDPESGMVRNVLRLF